LDEMIKGIDKGAGNDLVRDILGSIVMIRI
jgi:hypothetical protein